MTSKRDALRQRTRVSIDPDAVTSAPAPAVVAPAPPPTPEPERVVAPTPSTTDGVVTRMPTPDQTGRRAPTAADGARETALDDPAITPGRSNYRSFYVEDALFARFRAAIYWSSRREEAGDEVPVNMSVAVSDYMERTASELEKRFNEGQVFRPTPEQRKRRKKGK